MQRYEKRCRAAPAPAATGRSSISELVAEGNLGIVHALGKFDPERGIRLATHAAYWIRASILEHVVRSCSLVGGGSGVLRSRMFFKLRRERARVTNLLGEGEAADCEIARRVGTTPTKMREMTERLATRDVSLDATLPVGSVRLCDLLPASDDQEQRLFESRSRPVQRTRCIARLQNSVRANASSLSIDWSRIPQLVAPDGNEGFASPNLHAEQKKLCG